MRSRVLLVDNRVGSKDLAVPLRRLGLDVVVTRLEFADVAFTGRGPAGEINVGVELKTISDAVGSFRSGRLPGHQLTGLLRDYDDRWLVVEGLYRPDPQGRVLTTGGSRRPRALPMTVAELEGRLLTLQLCAGLRVRATTARWQTLRFLAQLYHWWTDREFNEHRSHLAVTPVQGLLPVSAFGRVVGQLPGVGREWARAAEQAFGTVGRAMGASVGEWAALTHKGRRLGTRRAETIAGMIRGRYDGGRR